MGFITPFPKKNHPLQEQAERFSAIFDAYFSQFDRSRGHREGHLTILARSPLSPACRMLCDRLRDLDERGVTVQMIFAHIGPAEPMQSVFRAVQRLNGAAAVPASLRWAQNPSLLDAHEQMTLGLRAVWTGDCMRRSSDNRNALDLFEENSIGSVRLADLAFSAMWMASKPIPSEVLNSVKADGDAMVGLDALSVAEALCVPRESAEVVKLRATN